ncbi:transmembrane protease serine 2 isoform X2 [Parasteatoda tepidariorum]|uniref:transmembrane protease serine 2 isoform X2 n=1 Tax=Parasteatoda tepidariorum TaxID=114398 RepID=UPI0039BCAAE3
MSSNEPSKGTEEPPPNAEVGTNEKAQSKPPNKEALCPLAEAEADDWKGSNRRRSRWKICLLVLNLFLLTLLLVLFLLWYLQILPQNLYVEQPIKESKGCSSLRLPLCHKYKVPYSYTVYPNKIGHTNQNEASEAMARYEPLVSVKCYSLLPLFLCTLYAPKCMGEGTLIPPCRSLCKETIRKCNFFLGVFSVSWPEDLDCDDLPESMDSEICVGHEQMRSLNQTARACYNGFRCDKTRCLPQSWVCDGFSDCTDEADEKNCSNCGPDQFYCGHGSCIDKGLVCDGIRDCPDGREERRCLRLNGKEGQSGEGRLEAYSLITDSWQPVCGDQWDTDSMSPRACQMLGYKNVKETRLRDEVLPAENRVATGTAVDIKKQMKSLFSRSHKGCGEDNVYVYLKCQEFECGKTAISVGGNKATWRIVGGKESEPGAWPWLVALHGGPDEVFFCGGVLISEWWVLSAAHCVGNQSDPTGWSLKLGMTRRPSHPSFTQRRGVAQILSHEAFNFVSQYSNDIVLIRLDKPVAFDSFLRPICLPPLNSWDSGLKSCTVIGWGKQQHDDAEYQKVIHQVEVPVVDFNTCQEWYSAQEVVISDTMLCAGFAEGQKDACQGDSGGPLVCKSDDHWFVAGVVSWGIKCAQPNLPGIYTNVSLYFDWIQQTTEDAGYPLYS